MRQQVLKSRRVQKNIWVVFWVLPFFATAQATRQHLFDTIPFIPDHTVERLAFFAKEPVVSGKIIFFGDSITEGGNWPELTGDATVVNRGIGGDITFGMLKRIDDVIKRKPSKLFILIGINDIGKDIPDAVITEKYAEIISTIQVQSPATKIYVQSILPLNNTVKGFPQHYDKIDHVTSTNQMLKKLAAGKQCTYVNLYPLFLDAYKRLAANYTADGLHLNRAGYQVWVNYLKKMKYL